jgi:MFS family permease
LTQGRIGRPGYTLLAAATVSRLATNTAPVALVLLAIARTRDARLAGLLVAAYTVPTLIAGPVLGAYLDQLRRKRLLFAVSQLVLAADLAAVLVLAGRVPGWLLAAFTLLAGASAPVLTGGYSSLVPLVVPRAALARANSLDAAGGVADGPALAATLTVRQGNVPGDRYAQTLATASSLKIAAYSAGSALAGLLTGVLTVRQLILGLACGQLLSAAPLLPPRRRKPLMSNEPVVSATPTHCS